MRIGLTHTPKKLVTGAGGFTLIELLIVVAISAVVMAGAVQLFIGARDSHELVKNMKMLEENGRIGMDILSREVRAATTATGGVPIYVWDNVDANNTFINGASAGVGTITRTSLEAKDGTDILEVFITKCSEPIVLSGFVQTAASISASTGGGADMGLIASCLPCYSAGDGNGVLLACAKQYNIRFDELDVNGNSTGYSCQHAITNVNEKPGPSRINITWNNGKYSDNANRPHQCDSPTTPAWVNATATIGLDVYYYIRKDDPYNANANNPIPQLMRYQVNSDNLPAEPIAYNVEDLQVLVGEDNTMDNTVTPPVPAPDGVINTWQSGIIEGTHVHAVKISLLIKSPKNEKNQTTKKAPPTLENSDISMTPDLRRRRTISRTVRIRNMN